MPSPHRIIAWANASQEPLLRDVVSHELLDLVAVGSEEADDAAKLSSSFQVKRIDHFRHAVQHQGADALWMASAGPMDAATIKLIRERGLRVLSCQPFPASLAELPSNPEDASSVRFTPLMRRSPGYRAAMDVLGDFGEVRCVNLTMRSGQGQGGLFARLFDAVDVIDSLCGEPEMIDAALVSPLPGVADDLSALHGHMTVNIRFPENRCACLAASNRAGSWFRGVTILGDGGCLRISDDGFEWIAEDGQVLDSYAAPDPTTPGSLIAAHIVRMLEHLDATDAPPDASRLLAACEAARLSCRTAEGETPRKVLKMLSHL